MTGGYPAARTTDRSAQNETGYGRDGRYGARLRLVVLDGLARPAILDGPPEDLLRQAYRAVAAD